MFTSDSFVLVTLIRSSASPHYHVVSPCLPLLLDLFQTFPPLVRVFGIEFKSDYDSSCPPQLSCPSPVYCHAEQ